MDFYLILVRKKDTKEIDTIIPELFYFKEDVERAIEKRKDNLYNKRFDFYIIEARHSKEE